MRREIIYVVAAVIIVIGVAAAVTPLRQGVRELAADLKIINADTGDVMASATYQRFAKRREAVASMRAALLQVAVIESTFVADSGRPTFSWFARYVPNDKYLVGPSVEIHRDRWVATVSHQHTTMSCTLTAMVDPATLDSITLGYHAGEPVCAEGSAATSTAVASAPVPINSGTGARAAGPAAPGTAASSRLGTRQQQAAVDAVHRERRV